MEAFHARGLPPPQITVTTFSVGLRTFLGMTGRFIIALPVSILELYADLFSLKRLPVELPMPQLPIAIVTLKNRTLSPTAQLLIECAREVTKSMAPGTSARQTNRFNPQRIGQNAGRGAHKSPA